MKNNFYHYLLLNRKTALYLHVALVIILKIAFLAPNRYLISC